MSGTTRSSKSHTGSFSLTPVTVVNTMLLLLAAALLFYYVVSANSVAAEKYRITVLKDQVAVLVDEQSVLAAPKTSVEDPSSLVEFARAHQMVEAKDATHLFEKGNVALGN